MFGECLNELLMQFKNQHNIKNEASKKIKDWIDNYEIDNKYSNKIFKKIL